MQREVTNTVVMRIRVMYQCNRCSCLFDAGELHGGVCDDCREEERQLEIRKEWNMKMRSRNITEQKDGQMVMFYGTG